MESLQTQREASERFAEGVRAASEAVDKALSLDCETADTEVKYAEWIALLATGGFAATLTYVIRLKTGGPPPHPKMFNLCLAAVLLAFSLSILLSAWVLRAYIGYRAQFRNRRTLVAVQSVFLRAHSKLVVAFIEANSILTGQSPEDQLYDDIVRGKGGSVVALMERPSKPRTNETYEDKKVREEAEQLAKRLTLIAEQMEEADQQRTLYGRRLGSARMAQLITTVSGYLILAVMTLL